MLIPAYHTALHDTPRLIEEMLQKGQFSGLFSVCTQSFQDIVPAIKFRKKREMQPETPRLLALSVICQYAPPLFEHAVLESLLEFVKSNRLLAKHENGYLEQAEDAPADPDIS